MAESNSSDGVKYYWCVNCGNYGVFQVPKFIGVSCQECHYDGRLTPFSMEEILEDRQLIGKFKVQVENTIVTGS